jgi:hypothetical protein
MSEPHFFIGWEGRTGPALGWFLRGLTGVALAALLGLALLLGASGADPAPAGFGGPPRDGLAEGPQHLEGVLTLLPYPVLHLPDGPSVLLAGDGKRGAPAETAALQGQRVVAEGLLLRRGGIAMLVLDQPPELLGPGAPPVPEALGRWRITGEVCDGKCAAGAMLPGTGLAHRACASLCVEGGLPAILVATRAVAGSEFLLLAAPDGRAADWGGQLGLRVALEGEVQRLGTLLLFNAMPVP